MMVRVKALPRNARRRSGIERALGISRGVGKLLPGLAVSPCIGIVELFHGTQVMTDHADDELFRGRHDRGLGKNLVMMVVTPAHLMPSR